MLDAVGARTHDGSRLLLRAIDGYAVALPSSDARRYRFIVATHLDDQPLALGGLGPLWLVYDADRFPDMAAKPLNERFGLCPWGCTTSRPRAHDPLALSIDMAKSYSAAR